MSHPHPPIGRRGAGAESARGWAAAAAVPRAESIFIFVDCFIRKFLAASAGRAVGNAVYVLAAVAPSKPAGRGIDPG